MNRLLSFRYARTVMYLVAVLLAFLVIVDVLILSQQQRYFRDDARGLAEHEVELLGMLLGRELSGDGYDRTVAERVLARWLEEHPDVVELRASTPDGGVLAEFSRETNHSRLFRVEHAVKYGENGLFSLEILKDTLPLETSLRGLSLKLVSASVLFAAMMGAVLWLTFRKTAIRPLETEIAERRRAGEALRESEEKFRAIFDNAMDGIALAGAEDNRVSIANETLCRMLGMSHEELKLMSLEDMHPVGHAPRIDGGSGKGKEKILYSAREIPVKRKDGSLFYANVTGALVSLGGKEYVMGIFRDVTDRRRAEESLRGALREKEVLLKEVHHRVKNNLAIVASLVGLQRRRMRDEELKGFLMDMEGRIRSIAMVHETLYQARDLAGINFSEYLNSLTSTIFRFYDMPHSSVGLKLDVPPGLSFDVSTMVPCGLILNELVTNALKYAFPGGKRGELSISLGPGDDDRYTLAVRDNGVGLPEGFDVRNAESLGLRLVGLLAEQLEGDLDVVRPGETGTEFRVTFKAG